MSSAARLAFATLLLAVHAWPPAAAAAESQDDTQLHADSMPWQRVFVPAHHPDAWPVDGQRYVSVERAEWDRLNQAIARRSALEQGPPVRIESALYDVTFRPGEVLRGTADLAVRLPGNQPRLLPLEPLGPRVVGVSVTDEGDDPPLGWWTRPGPLDPQFAVLVKQSGNYRLELEQSGVVSNHRHYFVLDLPPALHKQIRVRAPSDVAVEVESAVLQNKLAAEDGQETVWHWSLTSAASHELRITSAADLPAQAARVQYAQEDAYRVSPRGIDYETTLAIRSASPSDAELAFAAQGGEPAVATREAAPASSTRDLPLTLEVDPGLRLLGVSIDGQPSDWETDETTGAPQITLPSTSQAATVRIQAVAKFQPRQIAELPAVRLREATWSEGSARIALDPKVELVAIEPHDANHEGILGAGEPGFAGEAHRLQYWTADSRIAVAVAPASQTLSVEALTEVVLDNAVESVQTTLLLSSERPSRFALTLPISSGWAVESVDSMPSGEAAHWRVTRNRRKRILEIQLQRAPTVAMPLILKVTGRRVQRAIELPAKARRLEWLAYPGLRVARRQLLLQVRSAAERVAVSPGGLADASDIESLAERFKLAPPSSSAVALDVGDASDALVSAEQRPAEFSSETVVACAMTDRIAYQTTLLLRPRQGALREFDVDFSRSLPAGAKWTSGDGRTVTATPLRREAGGPLDRDSPVVNPMGAARYRISLSEATDEPFEISVTYRRDLEQSHAVDCAVTPGAVDWNGWALLLGQPGSVVGDARECAPAPIPPRGSTRLADLPSWLPVMSGYQFDEELPLELSKSPCLIQRKDLENATSQAMRCEFVDLASLHAADGFVRCRAVYALHPPITHEATFRFAGAVQNLRAAVDGQFVDVVGSAADEGVYAVTLPTSRTPLQLTIDFTIDGNDLELQKSLPRPWPITSFRAPVGRWTAWVPPQFRLELDGGAGPSWVKRILGPLVADRQSLPVASATPAAPPSTATDAFAINGWRPYVIDFVGDAPPAAVVSVPRRESLRQAMILLAVAAGAVAWSRFRRRVVALVCAAALLCLVAPDAWRWIPQAWLLGLPVGAAIAAAMSLVERRRMAWGGSATAPAAAWGAVVLIAASIPLAAQSAPDVAARIVPRVLIPIDPAGKTVGDELFVPASLLLERQAAAQAAADIATSVVTSAEWHFDFQERRGATTSKLPSMVRFRGEALKTNALLHLPLRADEATWLADRHTLGGAPVEVAWSDDQGCTVRIQDAGDFELRLYFDAIVERVGAREIVRMTTPPLAAATATLHGLDDVELLEARGAVPLAQAAENAPSFWIENRRAFSFSWTAPEPVRSDLRVDQLQQLTVDPAGSRLETLLQLTGTGAAPRELQLELTPNLTLVAPDEDARLGSFLPAPEQADRVIWELPPGAQLPLEVPLSFQLKRTVSVGRILFPEVRVVGVRTGRHLFAASINASLEFRQQVNAGLQRMPVAEFAELWNLPGDPADVAFSVVGPQVDWSLRVWPKASPLSATQELRLLCRADRIDVTCALRVAARDEESLIHRIVVPRDLELSSIVVRSLEHDEQIPTRWTRSGADEATLFLARPLREAHEIQLNGRMSATLDEAVIAPRFRLVDAETRSLTLRLDRSRDVTAQFQGDPPAPLPLADEPPSAEYARVGEFLVEEQTETSPAVVIRPNRVQAEAQTLITLSQEKSPAEVELTIALRAFAGLVDRFTIRAPPDWTTPELAGSPRDGLVRDLADDPESDRLIEVFLSKPLRDGERRLIQLRGRLVSTADRRIRLPNLRLPGIEEKKRFVVLPTESDPLDWDASDPLHLHWDWTNLNSQPRLPRVLASAAKGKGTSFQVTGPYFVAEQKVQPVSFRKFKIRAVDASATVDASGNAVATCRYILQTGAVRACELQLAEGAEFLQVAAGGRSLLSQLDGKRTCTIALSPPQMPIEIVAQFRQQLPWTRAGFLLSLPSLLVAHMEVPAANVRWRVTGAEGLRIMGALEAESIDPQEFENLALTDRRQAVQEASLLALQLPHWEAQQWYRQWRPMIPTLPTSPASEDSSDAKIDSDSDSAEPPSNWELLRERFEQAAADGNEGEFQEFEFAAEDRASCFASDQSTIELRVARDRSRPQRWLLAIVGGGLVLASQCWPEQTAVYLQRVRKHWPWFAAAAVVLLWLIVRPSLILVAILAAAAAAAIGLLAAGRSSNDDSG